MPADLTSSPYSFTSLGGEQNVFSFNTKDDIDYEIKFVPSSYLFDGYPELDIEVFEMIISVTANQGNRIPSDSMVGPTIALIFSHFMADERQAIIYICDSSDGRQKARSRKFSLWFQNRQTNPGLVKVDQLIIDGDQDIQLSLILFNEHPQKMAVIEVFLSLGDKGK